MVSLYYRFSVIIKILYYINFRYDIYNFFMKACQQFSCSLVIFQSSSSLSKHYIPSVEFIWLKSCTNHDIKTAKLLLNHDKILIEFMKILVVVVLLDNLSSIYSNICYNKKTQTFIITCNWRKSFVTSIYCFGKIVFFCQTSFVKRQTGMKEKANKT